MIMSVPFPPREGIGFYVRNLSKYLVSKKHEVQIITRGWARRTSFETVAGIKIWQPPFVPIYPFHVHLHGLFVDKLVRRIEQEIDLIHTHSPLSPVISSSRPTMFTVHSTILDDTMMTRVNSPYTLAMKLQAPFSIWLEKQSLRRAGKVNAISPIVASSLSKYPYCPSNVEIMWNGVDEKLFSPDQNQEREKKLVLTVCRLAPGKGLEDFIEAAQLITFRDSAFKFLVVGDGPLRKSLEQKIAHYKLEKSITITGHITNREELVNLYRRASVFVLPSHHEGLPTVVLEAMACGCPVVATEVGGLIEVISNGNNGFLVPARKPQQLAEIVVELSRENNLEQKVGFQARKTIEKYFSWRKIGANFIYQYESMLKN